MKKLLLIAIVFLNLTAYSQMQDLAQLVQGELVYNDIIFDNDNDLWGYFYLYKIDNEKGKDKMEYVVLDKNLNEINNGTFFLRKYKSSSSIFGYENRIYNNCILMGDELVLDISLKGYNFVKTISLTENSVSDELFLSNGIFTPIAEKINNSLNDSLNNKIYINPIYRGDKKAFVITQHNKYNNSAKEKKITLYNEKKKFMWTYVYNQNTSNKTLDKYTTFKFLNFYNDRIIAFERHYDELKLKSECIVALNFSTGHKEFEYEIENDSSQYNHRYSTKMYNDTLYIVGQYYNNKFTIDAEYLGYFRIAIDKDGKEISRKYLSWSDLSTPELEISMKGEVSRRHTFNRKSTLIFRDGSVSIVNEEVYKRPVLLDFINLYSFSILNISRSYYKDAYILNFDKNFNFKGSNIIEKEKNHDFSDFLYTQYIKDNSAAVACFQTSKRVKRKIEKELLINTIENGSLQTERIPLTVRKKYLIVPIPAKEGYIMLREYNKKDKYNQIRLERFNN